MKTLVTKLFCLLSNDLQTIANINLIQHQSNQGITYCIFLVGVVLEYIEQRSQYFIHPLHISYTRIQFGKNNEYIPQRILITQDMLLADQQRFVLTLKSKRLEFYLVRFCKWCVPWEKVQVWMCALDISINLFDYFCVLKANSIKKSLVVTSILYKCHISGGRDLHVGRYKQLSSVVYQQYLTTASRHKQKAEYELTPQNKNILASDIPLMVT